MVEEAKGGFYRNKPCITSHFEQRAILMDACIQLVNNKKYDETTKLEISYQILKSMAKLKYFKLV
jgi:hypothetical protein